MIKMTGTTIAGLIFKEGVILGADTRATMMDEAGIGTLIDHECDKICRLAKWIYCCGAGSASDMKRLSQVVEAYIGCDLVQDVPVISPVTMMKQTMYKLNDYLKCAFIIGGVDASGAQLYSIHTGGSCCAHAYCAMGSGLQPAIGVLDAGWTKDMCEQDALDLMVNTIKAGILFDLGSGNNVDITIIRSQGSVSQYKPYQSMDIPVRKDMVHTFPRGTTKVLSTQVFAVEKCGLKRKYDEVSVVESGDGREIKRLKK